MNSRDNSSVNLHCLIDGAAEIFSSVNRRVQKTYFTPILP
jgi:hypothetical protein